MKQSKTRTSKTHVRKMLNSWLEELPSHIPSNHHLERLKSVYGVDLEKTLNGMTYAQLSTVLCVLVAQNTKAYDDCRKHMASLEESATESRKPREVVHLRVVK